MGEAEYDLEAGIDSETEVEFYMGVTCNRCGADGFHWEYLGKQSRLFDGKGKLHSCPQPKGGGR